MPNQLPNAEHAQINPSKLRDYALNSEHATGRYKAAFFSQMGYTVADWQQAGQTLTFWYQVHNYRSVARTEWRNSPGYNCLAFSSWQRFR